uniref:Hist_deacetyl domain-containing protein n=1 Tax=Rhabditophanes sp. KR3021 TaxID=114890 RepID=A0AC35TRL9_9BILA
MERVLSHFRPEAIVLQLGADSLSNDRLGCFNLTLKGHGKCAEYLKAQNIPIMFVGGGGYTVKNVARCWTYETSIALDTEISNELPYNDYFEYFGPDFKLHLPQSNIPNANTREYLNKTQATIFQNLKNLNFAPSVQMHEHKDHVLQFDPNSMEDMIDPNKRLTQFETDATREHESELYDTEKEGNVRGTDICHNEPGT